MPSVVDYERVSAQAARQGLRCLYHNSGAFGFAAGVATWTAGWIGPADDSIRLAARSMVREVPPPYPATLATLASDVWRTLAPGPVWLMPKSHWAYELEFGSAAWMPAVLREAGVDPEALRLLNQAAAIAFLAAEEEVFRTVCESLLTNLSGSDFSLLFPGRPLLCTLHSHQQLWWTTADPGLFEALQRKVPGPGSPAGTPA